MPLRSGHLDIVRWYAATAEHPDCPLGFNASVLLERAKSPADDADGRR
jgi:hypothetical protein